MKTTAIGTRTINPVKDDFFRVVIEERKNLPKSHPHYLLLKIIANALYGIFAELNKEEFGKNNAKQLEVFSGKYHFDQTAFVVERPGRWQAYTRGLLLRRPSEAIIPLIPIGKEIERRSQEGEDISILDTAGPVRYSPRKTANTRPADAALVQRASRFPKKLLRRQSGVSQHAIDRFLNGERIHPATRKKLAQTVEELERSSFT